MAAAERHLEAGDARAGFEELAHLLREAPAHAPAWTLLGRLYLSLGRSSDAAQALAQACSLDPAQATAWQGRVQIALDQHDGAAAEALARAGLAAVPDDAALRHALAASLAVQDRATEAIALLDAHLATSPDDAAGWRRLGELLATERPADAVAAYRRSLARAPADAGTHHNLGLALEALGDREGALASMAQAVAIDPRLWPAVSRLLLLKRQAADWVGLDALSERLCAAAADGAPGVDPFALLAEPADPEIRLAGARSRARAAQAAAGRLAPPYASGGRDGTRTGPLRVGLFSPGLGNHPTALLVAELLHHLPDHGIACIAIATARSGGIAIAPGIAAACAATLDLSSQGPAQAIHAIRAADLDVLLDMECYTGRDLAEVPAARVAPVQVNWLATPGTSGAPATDYLIADPWVVPDTERAHVSEALLRLPRPYLPYDTRACIGQPPPRDACGLPRTGVVLACFSNGYKVTPDGFGTWMRILQGLPGAVLWLLGDPADARADRLRRAAASADVDPARLVFQPKLPHADFLARHAHVDLCLDTWPYGAHTTALDALWAGVPLLTLPGRSFSSRVGLGFLSRLGLTELVAHDADDYVARAIGLGRDPAALQALRGRLADPTCRHRLFDTPAFAADLARALHWMVERHRRGLPPADHDLPPTGC